jgi:hypothetical protein
MTDCPRLRSLLFLVSKMPRLHIPQVGSQPHASIRASESEAEPMCSEQHLGLRRAEFHDARFAVRRSPTRLELPPMTASAIPYGGVPEEADVENSDAPVVSPSAIFAGGLAIMLSRPAVVAS